MILHPTFTGGETEAHGAVGFPRVTQEGIYK